MASPSLRRTLNIAAALLACLSFVPGSSEATVAQREARVLEVKIAATMEFKSTSMWRVEMHKMVRDVSRGFKSRFGIAFKVKEWEFWQTGGGCRSLPGQLRDLTGKVPRGRCDLVIGIVPSTISEGPPFGAADYLSAYVLIKDHPSKSGLTCILEHELCHIFGAIDLDEKGSIMSLDRRGGEYDDFTTKIIALNRHRSFTDGEFPLTPEVTEKVASFYKGRLDKQEQGRGTPSGEEKELKVVLSHLHRATLIQAALIR